MNWIDPYCEDGGYGEERLNCKKKQVEEMNERKRRRRDRQQERAPYWWTLPVVVFIATSTLSMASLADTVGEEFQVNTYTTGGQERPTIAHLPSGTFVVVWQSTHGGASYDIFAQTFDSSGAPTGSEMQINTDSSQDERNPDVASDGDGNYVVVWNSRGLISSDPDHVLGQRYDSSGAPVNGEFLITTHTGYDVVSPFLFPKVASDSSGNFVVVWEVPDGDADGIGVLGQRYDSLGSPIGSHFQVNTYMTGSQVRPAVAVGPSGSFLVVWLTSDFDASGQFYDGSGSRLGDEFQVNTTPVGIFPKVASDPAGRFVVVWSNETEVLAQRYDPMGAPLGSETLIGASSGFFAPVDVATDLFGNFVVAWRGEDQDSFGVMGRRFNSFGSAVGIEFQVNAYTAGSQNAPDASADIQGKFVVVWQSEGQDGDGNGVFGQRFAAINPAIFADGFESGDTSAWSGVVP